MAMMSDDELRALTDSEMRQSIGYFGGKLAEQRRKAEYYYLGLAKGDLSPPEIEGRSAVVSTDVRNTVESMLPQLMVKFTGGDTVVEFEPTKSGDEEEQKAKTATDYLNYIFYKKNNGHKVAYTWMKDALLQKVGIVKVWWDNRTEETREEYRGLNEIELAELLDDEEVEPIEQKTYPDEDDAEQRQQAIQQLSQQGTPEAQMQIQQIMQMPPKMLYDVSFKRSKKCGKVAIENVPPEEFLISRKAKSIDTATFVGHRVWRTKSDLLSMGYPKSKVDNLASDDSAAVLNAERVERLAWDDEQAYLNVEQQTLDESQMGVWLTECYIRVDYDGDGISELRKVVRAGNEILENEVVDIAPFVSICPVPLPHKFFGLSVADLAEEPQRIKTNIMRAVLDNMYLQTNGRYFAVEGQVNLDDLLTSRPGGVVRIKQQGAVGPLNQGMADGRGAMSTLEYMENFLENATGWTRYSQGNDSQSLNKTATGVNIITSRADMRLDLIARNFAEGFVELFRMMLKLVTQYQDKEDVAKLNGQWTPIDPREWRNQFDVTVNVGLGAGNKDQQVAHLMTLLQVQREALQVGVTDPEGVYQAAKELAKAMGFKSGEKFFKDPAQQPPVPPQPNPDEIKIQADAQKFQAQSQLDIQKTQAQIAFEREKLQMQEQIRQHELEVEAQKQAQQAALDMQERQHQAELSAQLELQKMQFEKWKAELDAEVRLATAQISATSGADPATTAAADQSSQAIMQTLAGLTEAIGKLNAPKQIVRDQNGRAVGVAPVENK